jgi:hypothetical protein|tara:strand:- start:532 stop:1761 length:1230 start_codon:yes stop_codon:yes gene_type:complete
MEMIDVIKRLNEISQSEITEKHGGEHSTTGRSMTGGEMDKREKIVKGMKKDKAGFKKRYGKDADAVMYATATKQAMADDEVQERVGGMSDIMIGAEEALTDYVNDDGDLKMPKRMVIQDLMDKAKKASMPTSYELETAAKMVNDKFNDDGDANEGQTDEGNAFAQAVQQAKAAGMKKGDKFKVGDEEHTLRDSDFEEINTNTMETKDKKEVKEDIKITADTPEEAGMLMQILKMAGVKPVDASMMGMDKPDMDHGGMDKEMDPGAMNTKMDVPGDDAMGSMQMAKMRDMMTKPDMEKQEETFANSPADREKDEPKTQDIDSLVNVHSGGLNKQKVQYKKEYPGDNPMAVEDTITEQDLANSLRTQYEGFKQAYQEAAKAKPDYIDLDKDGNKTEPMKKAAKDKEAKDKK